MPTRGYFEGVGCLEMNHVVLIFGVVLFFLVVAALCSIFFTEPLRRWFLLHVVIVASSVRDKGRLVD